MKLSIEFVRRNNIYQVKLMLTHEQCIEKKAQFVTERGKGKKDERAEKSKSEAIA